MRSRTSWHGFSARVAGILTTPIRAYAPDGSPLPYTRLQTALRDGD